MPVIRYQIRNEYGLADPELYRTADREDPEALLEGVAMAGLVGVLRQLGDLAEFAAEIFHGLHEEVMATAARGHGLILRVQQLEAEFPAIEKAFLSQTSHSHLTCIAGIDWHPNLKVDQNVITQGDMPRFILDSYEECRGPPRLFELDKFDIAGAGACSKRYSDPSFFKMDLASSGTMEPEIQREKKARKVKRKGPRWKNGEPPVTAAQMNSILQIVASDKLPENIPVKRVKLKSRHLNDIHASNKRSYMARILEKHSPEHIVICENSASHCHVKKSVDSSELASEVHVVGIDTSACIPTFRDRTPREIPNTQEITKVDLKELSQKPNGELVSFRSNFQKAEENKLLAHTELRDKDCADSYRFKELEKIPVTFRDVDQKEPKSDAEMKADGSTDGYRSDDITSELDNYMDALATMESEMDTDTESRGKPYIDSINIEHIGLDSDMNEEQLELQAHSLGRHSVENSSAVVDDSIGQSSVSSETSSRDIAGLQLSQGNGSTYSGVCTDLETDPSENPEFPENISQIKEGISDFESSSSVVPNGTCTLAVSDAPGLYEYKEASCSSSVTESKFTPFPFCPPISPGEVLSDTLYPNKVSSNFVESTEEIARHLVSDLSPQAGPDDDQLAAASINEVFYENSESFEDYDKHSYDDSIHAAGSCKTLSQTDADMLLPGRVESSEILHHAIPNATNPNVTESSIGISDGHIPVQPLHAEYVEELASDNLSNMSDAPDKDIGLNEDAISENASIGDGEGTIFLTVCNEELGRSMKQDPQPDSGDSAEYLPVFSLENSLIDMQTDGSLVAMENVVPPCESSECPLTIPGNSGNLAKHERQASSILPLGSQLFYDTYEHYVDSEELLPSDSVRETIPDIPDAQTDGSLVVMENGVPICESSECPVSIPENSGNSAKHEQQASDIFPLDSQLFSDTHEHHVGSVELLPSDSETIPDSPAVLSNASDHEVRDGLMPTGDLQTSRCITRKLDNFSQTTKYHPELLELLPSCSGQELPDILEARSNASDHEEIEDVMPIRDCLNMPHDSIVANTIRVVLQATHQEPHGVDSEELLPSCSENEMTVEVLPNASDGQSRDLPMPESDHNLQCSFIASNPPVGVEGQTSFHELISENTSTKDDSDGYIFVKNCSGEGSDIPIHVQEEYISADLVSDKQNLQINETSSSKDLRTWAAQTFPDIILSLEKEDEVVLAPTNSKSGQQILNLLDHSGVGLVNHVYLTEPAQHAQVDMSPTNSYKDTISLLESERNSNSKSSEEHLFRCSNLQEECISNDCTSDQHKLEITEASSQKDLMRFSDQGTPQVLVSDHEEVNTVFSPRDLKAEELVVVSPDHAGSEALNCIDHTVSSEHAKLDLNASTAKENTVSPIEGGPYWASAQCHPSETASDISPSHSLHTESVIPLEESSKLQAGRESTEITLQPKDRNLEHSDCQFASAQSFENSVTSNGCSPVDVVSKASEPDTHALVMDGQINSLESESVLFQPSSELSISSLNSNFSPVSILTFPELSLPIQQPFEPPSDGSAFSFSPREGNALQSYVEEAPPLPPLPPLEWRMGKLQLGSVMSDGMSELPNRHNPFMQLLAMDDSHGSIRVEGEMMQPLNPFAEVPMSESKSHQHSYLTLEGESLHSLESLTLPFFEDGRCNQGTISVDGKMGHPLRKSLMEESHMEDDKHLRGHGVFEKEILPPSNPFAPVPTSFCETLSSERDLIHPFNPFLSVSTTADEMFHYDYRDFRGENVQHLRTSRPLSAAEDAMAHHSYLTTVGEVHFMDNVLPTTADGIPIRNPHSILNRPRDPLIEAVASHDKSTLRKVSELVLPSTKPKMDERETLLEQIRNKSFNLKPAVSAKPNIKGPSTNLKVAAILEKANAIRQAVGSDEDDDGDSWSDC